MKPLCATILLVISFGSLKAQLADTLVPSALIIPPKYANIYDSAETVYLPKGFECSVFYTQSGSWTPRMLAIDPAGKVCVADMGNSQVYAFPDNDHDGIADTAIRIAYNDGGAQSIAFYRGALYTAASTFVMKYEHPNSGGLYADSSVFIANIPNTPEGADNEHTRTIFFDTIGKNIFLSVGAPCNACREKDTTRASILRFDLDGSGRRMFASGLRNAVGLTMDPASNELWTSVAERNNQGADVPREFATHVVDGGFYGWPLAFGDHQWDNLLADSEYAAMLPTTADDTAKVNTMQVADMFFHAHSTPLSLVFNYAGKFPSAYTGNIFVALHGSYNGTDGRLIAVGSKIMRAQKIGGRWITSDFATGFLTDSLKYLRWARPCGIIIDTAGDLYFSSDHTSPHTAPAIFKISYTGVSSVRPPMNRGDQFQVFPNPASGIVTIKGIPSDTKSLVVVNALGAEVRSMRNLQNPELALDLSKLIAGIYYFRFTLPASVVTKMVIKM